MTRFPLTAVIGLGVVLAGAAAPASAQRIYYPPAGMGDDIVVYGTPRLPDEVTAASQRVSYDDLHLQYSEDRAELRRRVRLSADYVCDALGENDFSSSSVVASCRDNAIRDAMRQVRSVEQRYSYDGRYADRGYDRYDRSHVWLPEREW